MTKLETLEPVLDDLFNVSQAYGARVSPDGRSVGWIAVNVGPTAQLWWAPTDGSGEPRVLVANERDCDYFFWAPDSQSVILGQSRDGDERIGLSRIGLDGSRRDLTDQHPDYYIRGGQLAPAGSEVHGGLVQADRVDGARVTHHDGTPPAEGLLSWGTVLLTTQVEELHLWSHTLDCNAVRCGPRQLGQGGVRDLRPPAYPGCLREAA